MYTLEVARQDTYLHAVVTAAPDGPEAPTTYIEAVARHFVRHDCSHLLIENHLDQPFKIWDAVSVAPLFGRHTDECIQVAIVEINATPTGQRELTIHMSEDKTMTVRVFETNAEAQAWFGK